MRLNHAGENDIHAVNREQKHALPAGKLLAYERGDDRNATHEQTHGQIHHCGRARDGQGFAGNDIAQRQDKRQVEDVRAEELLISLVATGRLPGDIASEEDFLDSQLRELFLAMGQGRSPASLAEVENPSEMLLSGRPDDAPGTCVTCVMEGMRPVLAEIQALVVTSAAGNPRRTSNGFDYNRAAMLLAVLEKRVR